MKFIITSWICFFLIFSPLTVSGQEKDETLLMGRAEGELSAEQNYSAGAWFAGGLASGFLLGLLERESFMLQANRELSHLPCPYC